jgi:putative endonuclease
MYTVYVLYSQTANKHYVGFTGNLDARMISHNELGNDWTAKYKPWKLIYTINFSMKTDAMKYEKWLKSGVGRDFIKTIKH